MKTTVMGLQHLFVMFGATVLVPLLTGLDVGVTLFASGVGTLVFHAITKFQVPVYLGSSFAFIPAIVGIAGAEGGSLQVACGGIVIAGLVYVGAAALVKFASPRLILRILPAHVTGPMIILIGLVLAPVAIQNAEASKAPEVLDRIGKLGSLGVALLTFGVGVAVKIYGPKLGLRFLATLPVLAAMVVGYFVSFALGIVDTEKIASASWLGTPQFATPEFQLGAVFVALPVAIVTIIEHLGDVLAIGNVVGKNFVKEPGLHRTLLGDGVATSISALLGGPANTTYSENTGTVALTGNHNPAVMRIAAGLAIATAFVPKISALIATVPPPVVGGISVLLFGMIASIGIKTLLDNRVDLGRPKILIITSAMLVMGLGGATVEIGGFGLTGLGLAAVAGIVLNGALPNNE